MTIMESIEIFYVKQDTPVTSFNFGEAFNQFMKDIKGSEIKIQTKNLNEFEGRFIKIDTLFKDETTQYQALILWQKGIKITIFVDITSVKSITLLNESLIWCLGPDPSKPLIQQKIYIRPALDFWDSAKIETMIIRQKKPPSEREPLNVTPTDPMFKYLQVFSKSSPLITPMENVLIGTSPTCPPVIIHQT
jgi:hypothetical protein